ncbi:MAG: hypothetical protein AAF721_33000, partial [Myxococcota bacterium]
MLGFAGTNPDLPRRAHSITMKDPTMTRKNEIEPWVAGGFARDSLIHAMGMLAEAMIRFALAVATPRPAGVPVPLRVGEGSRFRLVEGVLAG